MISETDYLTQHPGARYENPAFTVDLVIFTVYCDQLHLLLIKRAETPFKGYWSLPGGFLNPHLDDTVEACAQRTLLAKTGLVAPYLEQLKTYGSRYRDPRGWTATTAYFALMASEAVQNQEDVRWMPIQGDKVAVELAFDHCLIVADATERLRSKLEYTHIAVHLLPEAFTLPQLQRIYEIILQEPLDKSSFRRRVAEAGMLEAVTGKWREGEGRPAQLYRFSRYTRQTFFPRSLSRHAR